MSTTSLTKKIAYGALDLLTMKRGVPRRICGERILFPARYSRYYEEDYERDTFAFLTEHCQEGGTALDIGAHIGLFSVVMARSVGSSGRVFAFEPTENSRNVLRETVRLNKLEDRVEVRGEAAAESSGTATFFDTGNDVSNANSLVATNRHQPEKSITIETTSIDDFAQSRGLDVSCLKIDAEGAELGVLRGAEHVLSSSRPVLALALHPDPIRESGGSLDEIWQLLRHHDLTARYGGKLVDGKWFCEQEGLFDVQCQPE